MDVLERKHLIAIENKFNGKTYAQIIEIIKEKTGESLSIQSLKSWFMTTGKLFKPYLRYSEKHNELRILESKNALKSLTSQAVKVVRDAMIEYITVNIKCPHCNEEFVKDIKIPTNIKIAAAKEVLDRGLGKAEETVNIIPKTSPYDELKDDDIKQRTKQLEERIKGTEDRETKKIGE